MTRPRHPGGRRRPSPRRARPSPRLTRPSGGPPPRDPWSPETLADALEARLRASARDLVGGPTAESILGEIVAWAAGADDELGPFWARPGPDGLPVVRQPECRVGCCHCCYQHIAVTAIEAEALARHILRVWGPGEVVALRRRLAREVDRLRALVAGASGPEDERRALARLRRPCPLLDEATGQCRAYEARPVNCRRENSVDVEVCRRYREDPDATDSSLRLVRYDLIWGAAHRVLARRSALPEGAEVFEPLEVALARALDAARGAG